MAQSDQTQSDPADGRPWARRLWRVIPALLVLALVAVILSLFNRIGAEKEIIAAEKMNAKATKADTNVVTLTLAPRTISERISLPGEVSPWVVLNVPAELPGPITAKHITEGQRVEKNDLLATVDARDAENSLKATQANYEAAAATLGRLKGLYDKQLATRAQLDDAVARVDSLKANLNLDQLRVRRSRIRTPTAGIVNRVFVEVGQYVGVGDPVAGIIQIDRVKVRVGIPESDVGAVRKINTFSVRIDALGGRVFEGQKYYLSRTADPAARLYDLQIEVPNPDHAILPDMFVRVEIVKRQATDALAVPLFAVSRSDTGEQVYVVEDGVAMARPVTLGIQEGWIVEVVDGLTAGEALVVVGQRELQDGERVNVVQRAERLEEIQG
jgi:RND family efflux transporter MFP subunit